MKKWIFVFIMTVPILLLVLYFVIPIGMPNNLVSNYHDTSNKTNSGKSKFYQDFFMVYFGNSSEDDGNKDGEENIVGVNPEPIPTISGLGFGTRIEAETVVSEAGSKWGLGTGNWKICEAASRYFPVDNQKSNTAWQNVKANSGSSITKQGCMLYALAATMTAKTGELWTLGDMLVSWGYSVKVSNGKISMSPNLPCVGLDSNKTTIKGVIMTPQALLKSMGLEVSGDLRSIDDTKLNGTSLYVVYCSNDSARKVSSSGAHWFLIVGGDGNKYDVVAGSGSEGRTGFVDANYVKSVLNHAYLVE